MARLFRNGLSDYVFEVCVIGLIVGMGLMTVWEMREVQGPVIGVVTARVEIPASRNSHVDGIRVAVGADSVVARGKRIPGELVCVRINRGKLTGMTTSEVLADAECLLFGPK
ncbi:MAG: hypothetical protein ACPGVA_08055 [Pikeienuella sp.]